MTRKQIYDAYHGKKTKTLERYFLKYDRYHEARMIYEFIKDKEDINTILDYGCGVGDYGMYLDRKNHIVEFYDIDCIMTNFVMYRSWREKKHLTVHCVLFPKDLPYFNVIIFGEVLEHMNNPLEVLQECINVKVPMIVTTAYPYIQDPKEFERHQEGDYHSHTIEARDQQPQCRELLESNYDCYNPEGEFRIWHNLGKK